MALATTSSTMPTTPLLLHALLDRGPRLQPDNLMVQRTEDGGYHATSYGEHAASARALALGLDAAGLGRGDRVATFCWNTNVHLHLYHAVPCMGAVLHPLNIRLGTKELKYIITDAADAIAFVDHDLLPRLAAVDADGLSPLRLGVVVCGPVYSAGAVAAGAARKWTDNPETVAAAAELRRKGVPAVVDFDDFLARARSDPRLPSYRWPEDIDENAAAGMCYTSGTTGNPKGVVYSHRSTFLHTLAMPSKDNHDVGGADVYLPVVPYFHANGWGIPYLALMLGMRVLHSSRYMDSATTLAMAVDHGATHSAAVPAIWQEARAALEANAKQYAGRLKPMQILCGGSAPSNEMMRWYLETYGIRFAQGWGMTETSPMGSTAKSVSKHKHLSWSEEERFANVTKAGIPSAGVEARIVDPENLARELPQDGRAQGELLVRGPWITARYYKSDRGEFPEGWLATGDVASIDADGNIIIRDRSKDVIKSGGEWISSIDLEKHIVALPAVSMVAVVAQPHPKWDERPVCVLVTAPPPAGATENISLEKIRDHCASSFAKYELPDDVIVWPELPMTGTGKIDKKAIRARLQNDGYRLPSLRAKL